MYNCSIISDIVHMINKGNIIFLAFKHVMFANGLENHKLTIKKPRTSAIIPKIA
jgi:hypothetical protein